MLESLNIIRDKIKQKGYDRIQYLPSRRSIALGRELYVFRSFFRRKEPCIFHSTAFRIFYHAAFKRTYPLEYRLYKVFFQNEPVEEGFLLGIFDPADLARFIEDGVAGRDSRGYRFNFRIVPFEGLFVVGKSDLNDPNYAHLNYDTVMFIESFRMLKLNRRFNMALEIGCGAGLISMDIAKFCGAVDAVDINQNAIRIMDLNARLNGLSNIHVYFSDCYKAVTQKYDLIVSNPPFELMPDEDKGVLHRYGGYLGMEIAARILDGLDNRMTDTGEAVVLTNSYIKNFREDTLKNALMDMFADKAFEITLRTLSYQINPDFYPVYKKQGVTHSIAYLIHVKRAKKFKITVIPLNFFAKIKETLRLAYLYIFCCYKRI